MRASSSDRRCWKQRTYGLLWHLFGTTALLLLVTACSRANPAGPSAALVQEAESGVATASRGGVRHGAPPYCDAFPVAVDRTPAPSSGMYCVSFSAGSAEPIVTWLTIHGVGDPIQTGRFTARYCAPAGNYSVVAYTDGEPCGMTNYSLPLP